MDYMAIPPDDGDVMDYVSEGQLRHYVFGSTLRGGTARLHMFLGKCLSET